MREQIEVGGCSGAEVPAVRRSGPSVDQRGRRRGRRRAPGPSPARPEGVSVASRPARPAPRCSPARVRRRVLAGRRSVTPPDSRRAERVLRGMAGLGVAVLSAAVVVGLGLLAGAGGPERGSAPAGAAPRSTVTPPLGRLSPPAHWATVTPAPGATVTVAPGETLWDVARRVAPTASGAELAGVAERIATDNSLTSVRLRPGQALRVTGG